jgi:hypothetical protein
MSSTAGRWTSANRTLLTLLLIVSASACEEELPLLPQGDPPISAVRINRDVVAPGEGAILTRGSNVAYSFEGHYDIRASDFGTPEGSLFIYAGHTDDEDNIVVDCILVNRDEPLTETSGPLHFSGTMHVPATGACASSATFVGAELSIWNGTDSLDFDAQYYGLQ